MKNNNNSQINLRTSKRNIDQIKRNAESCGMTVTQFLIMRGLGYEPQPLPPAVFFQFIEKLDDFQDYGIPSESKQEISALTNDIRKSVLEMRKEDLQEWLSQVSGR